MPLIATEGSIHASNATAMGTWWLTVKRIPAVASILRRITDWSRATTVSVWAVGRVRYEHGGPGAMTAHILSVLLALGCLVVGV